MCPRSLENDGVGFAFVDEEPVRLDVALTPPGKDTVCFDTRFKSWPRYQINTRGYGKP